MSSTLFLEKNSIDYRWKVVDIAGLTLGDGATMEKAIASARIVTNDPILLPSGSIVVSNPKEDSDIYTTDELIDELANLAGMRVIRVSKDDLTPCGYYMELKE